MRFLRLAILLALLAVIGSAAVIGYNIFLGSSSSPLPPLRGTSVVEAVATLEKIGLQARIDQQESSLPQGTVISQWPEAGRKLRSDKIVTLRVSQGTQGVAVPDVRRQPEASAVAQLQNQGFAVGDLLKVSASEPAGTVIAQNPAYPANIPSSQKVDLLVSLGQVAAGKVILPDVVDKKLSQAQELLSASGLRTSVTWQYGKSTPTGMVIAMSPRAGSSVAQKSKITLTVATTDKKYATQPTADELPQAGPTTATGAKIVMVTPAGDAEPAAPAENAEAPSGTTTATLPAQGEQASPATVSAQGEQAAPGPAQVDQTSSAQGRKTATVRYQVPPVKGMSLRIEMTDRSGTHKILERQAKPSETISLNVPYTGEAIVTIFLGGEFVWQDRYK
ncbi:MULTISPECIES: PASTA domain-containing protein [Jonquetella]|uniref:PASTA domain-containing protein n=1 Tax=Jonquetella anthropi DSM 22815 TaxID=885272 RepID=H0UJ11_9BACT|nr:MULTISPECIES: PASTA domain-containing protein [Jonquetella]EHM13838.1 hypothetical protein JonanDRAFT_1476 [Jonquetella anthropi DSM 22815]ERL23767.1 PASTA domain protein [Jonquetella sp. BV3C21]